MQSLRTLSGRNTTLSPDELARSVTLAGELTKVLGRAPGAPLPARLRARGEVLYYTLLRGALEGEMYAIASGLRDEELGFNPSSRKSANPREHCKDCQAVLSSVGTMSYDPSRCVECGRARKRQQNDRYRNKTSAPQKAPVIQLPRKEIA